MCENHNHEEEFEIGCKHCGVYYPATHFPMCVIDRDDEGVVVRFACTHCKKTSELYILNA